MAQLNLGQVVPDIEITETSDGKNVKFTTLTQEVNTLIKDGKDAISPFLIPHKTKLDYQTYQYVRLGLESHLDKLALNPH